MRDTNRVGPRCASWIRNFLARTLIPTIATVAVSLSPAWATEPAVLTSLHAVHTLTKAEARRGLPVAFEATATYYNGNDVDLFVQEGGEAIYVQTKQNEEIAPGDRVLVRGRTRASFSTDVVGESVTVLSHGALPKPLTASFAQLINAELDCKLVTVRAKVRSADTVALGTGREVYLRLLMDGGYIDVAVVGSDSGALKDMLDADVEVTGAVSGKFDSKMQLIGVLLQAPSLANVKVLKRAQTTTASIPLTPMDKILSSYSVQDNSSRVRVQGTITYYQPGSAVVLQDGAKSLWISTHTSDPMRIGDLADATGFPDGRSGFLTLDDGEVRDSHIFEPIQPQPSIWHDLADWISGDGNGHQNDLVSIEGEVAAAVREESQDKFDLMTDGKLFTAIYRHPPNNVLLPPMKQIAVGTRIRVTGICMIVQGNDIDPGAQEAPFNILLRSFDDIAVITKPSLLNVRNLILLVSLLLVLLFAAGVRGLLGERRMRRQNAASAYIERRRSRILEDINGSRPLAEIIEQITELVSFKLSGAPCWCQIVDGAQLGNCPRQLTSFRIVQEQMPGRSGSSPGTMYAAFDPRMKPRAEESRALIMAAAQAALAIENRRLYADLQHRTEFDLLTEIHNRFSLEQYLETQIEVARQNAGIFGLIYIDLDKFKQVNDQYGHQVGDMYLREAALRMKGQLRSHDMLARLGGDEFAVLVPMVHSHAEVEEIVHRLKRSFDAPFTFQGYVLHGSASVGIAVYPEDGSTKDSLLSAADAAMYVNKNIRQQDTSVPANRSRS